MVTTKVSNKRQRDIQRLVHLIAAVVLVGYVYLPLDSVPFVTTLMQVVVVPVVGVTGMLMWQLPKLRKRLRQAAERPAQRPLEQGKGVGDESKAHHSG